jgi:hypothetical protein
LNYAVTIVNRNSEGGQAPEPPAVGLLLSWDPGMKTTVTLDTNCLFEYFERDPSLIQQLIDFQEQGYIDIAITTRVMTDTNDKWKGNGKSPIWAKIQLFPILEIIGTAFRINISRLGSKDYVVSDEDVKLLDDLQKTLANAQIEDIDHLFGHLKAKRDIFVTSDGHFLDYKEKLMREFGIIVLNPFDAIDRIKKSISQEHNHNKRK